MQSWTARVVELHSPEQAPSRRPAQLALQSPTQAPSHSALQAQPLKPGDRLFIKTHAEPPPRHFTTEANGLRWLAEVPGLSIPAVLGVDDDPPWLALSWISEGRANARTESDLGESLAQLHQAPCPHFGRADRRSTGSLGLPNEPCVSWADFYATQRLLPLAAIAAERAALSTRTLGRIEKLAGQLAEFEDASVSASRLHGDLWAGNRLVDTDGRSWLIDPACHGGHREFDLAMMRLFGGFSEDCHAAYQAALPLAVGWQERIALHQLAPLIVHSIKFGSAYVASTEAALDRFVS